MTKFVACIIRTGEVQAKLYGPFDDEESAQAYVDKKKEDQKVELAWVNKINKPE